ncbi:DNA/RNA non-specific endonuclease [Acanthopleuribacter pedis]|uniref:DNA/RNA non-specific endonuclease n=1 Tax=Acanthopleuribacter pedis TaxID=442870 RepID=A0A8J7QFL5_9BACT|nr:DNA/RNA non-specific endonuclease [Acanthopleuribacter pedis]MBO1323469.1 DNA/RNA non-specific endonuclease [Acanthopleuribacter pedis]
MMFWDPDGLSPSVFRSEEFISLEVLIPLEAILNVKDSEYYEFAYSDLEEEIYRRLLSEYRNIDKAFILENYKSSVKTLIRAKLAKAKESYDPSEEKAILDLSVIEELTQIAYETLPKKPIWGTFGLLNSNQPESGANPEFITFVKNTLSFSVLKSTDIMAYQIRAMGRDFSNAGVKQSVSGIGNKIGEELTNEVVSAGVLGRVGELPNGSKLYAGEGKIKYRNFDSLNRSRGAIARIDKSMLGTGTKTKSGTYLRDFDNTVHSRGHLIAKMFGGSGTAKRNLAVMFNRVNNVVMEGFEKKVFHAVEKGEVVYLHVRPVYKDNSNIPEMIVMIARGSNGFRMREVILNIP